MRLITIIPFSSEYIRQIYMCIVKSTILILKLKRDLLVLICNWISIPLKHFLAKAFFVIMFIKIVIHFLLIKAITKPATNRRY